MTERTSVPRVRRGRHRAQRPVRVLVALFLTALGILLGGSTARAENSVVNSSPGDGSTLDQQIDTIFIAFAEALGEANTITLTCNAEQITLPRPEVIDDDTALQVEVTEPLPAGVCTVAWAVSDSDGAPNGRGVITFTVGEGAAVDPATSTTDAVDTSTATSTTVAADTGDTEAVSSDDEIVIPLSVATEGNGPIWLGRLLSSLGIAVLFGSLVLIAAAWPEGVEYLVTIKFLRAVWVLAAVGTLLLTAASAAAVTDSGFGSGFSPAAWLDLLEADWAGRALVLRFLFVLASVWVAFRPDRVIDPATQLIAFSLPALATAMIGITRTVGDGAVIGSLLGVVHALAMAVWAGGVVLLARVVLAGPGEEDLVHAVRGFGRISMLAIIVTIATGVVQLVRLDGGGLFDTGHGRVLLLKTVVVAAMVFVAMSARQFVAQRMARAMEMSVPLAARLRRAFGMEAGIGVATLALSAWLLALVPPNVDTTPSIPYQVETTFQTTDFDVPDAGLEVGIRLTDDRVGLIGLEVDVDSPETGVSGLTVTFTAPPNEQNLGAIVQPVPLTGEGRAVRLEENGLPFTVAGDWEITVEAVVNGTPVTSGPQIFRVRTEDGAVVTTAVTIPPPNLVVVTTTIPTTDG